MGDDKFVGQSLQLPALLAMYSVSEDRRKRSCTLRDRLTNERIYATGTVSTDRQVEEVEGIDTKLEAILGTTDEGGRATFIVPRACARTLKDRFPAKQCNDESFEVDRDGVTVCVHPVDTIGEATKAAFGDSEIWPPPRPVPIWLVCLLLVATFLLLVAPVLLFLGRGGTGKDGPGAGAVHETTAVGRTITEVQIVTEKCAEWEKCEDRNTRTVKVRYGRGLEWEELATFPEEAKSVTAAVLADSDGDGSGDIVVVGTACPVVDGDCVFAYDSAGNKLWSKRLESHTDWPDIDTPPGTAFKCWCIAKGDIDDRAGEELVVAASLLDLYPAMVVVVAPQDGELGATFWHMGQISDVKIGDTLLDGRPGIVARGVANKLDGFREPRDTDDAPRTCWDTVDVLMVLNPEAMDGLGPPWSDRVDLKHACPVSYVFLDLPAADTPDEPTNGCGRTPIPQPGQKCHIAGDLMLEKRGGAGAMRIRVTLEGDASSALFCVDQDLNIREWRTGAESKGFWLERWHRIVEDGRCIRGACPPVDDGQ